MVVDPHAVELMWPSRGLGDGGRAVRTEEWAIDRIVERHPFFGFDVGVHLEFETAIGDLGVGDVDDLVALLDVDAPKA